MSKQKKFKKQQFLKISLLPKNNSLKSKQHYNKHKIFLLRDKPLPMSGINKLERNEKGKAWSKYKDVNKVCKWRNWNTTEQLLFKMGVIPEHII